MTPPVANSEGAWLEQARALMLRAEPVGAESVVQRALQAYPHSFELRRILAGAYAQTGRESMAESLLQTLRIERPADAGTAFTLARVFVRRNHSRAAATVMRGWFEHARQDAELAIRAIELLDDCGRKRDAASIAEGAVAANPADPRLHAWAGMLGGQLGEFERARAHDLFALEHLPQACEWHIPYGLALMQRYPDARHPDFERFRGYLERADLGDRARSTLLFALAKAHDDIGDYEQAAGYSRQANAIAHRLTQWSRKHWRSALEARLNSGAARPQLQPRPGFTPIFVVGVPRSGTTLVAELLACHPDVCNRGESPALATLAEQMDRARGSDLSVWQHAAATYAAQLRQDDAQTIRCFIDKQPLNFRYVDLMLALFSDARIIYCQRNARDNALSLWLQAFVEEVQGYAYDFSDIALVMHDCERLMARWRGMHADSIRVVCYERLVAEPEATIAELATWLDLPTPSTRVGTARPSSIDTASVWQARQPVHTRSIGRWRAYERWLPELMKFKTTVPESGAGQCDPIGNIM